MHAAGPGCASMASAGRSCSEGTPWLCACPPTPCPPSLAQTRPGAQPSMLQVEVLESSGAAVAVMPAAMCRLLLGCLSVQAVAGLVVCCSSGWMLAGRRAVSQVIQCEPVMVRSEVCHHQRVRCGAGTGLRLWSAASPGTIAWSRSPSTTSRGRACQWMTSALGRQAETWTGCTGGTEYHGL